MQAGMRRSIPWQEQMTTKISLSGESEHAGTRTEPGAAGQGAEEFYTISLFDLLIVIAERKRFILWVTAVFALLALGIALLLPNRYTATVTLMTPQQNLSMGSLLASQMGNMGGMAALATGGNLLKNPNDTFVGLLTSRTVEDAMVQHFGLMEEYGKKYLSDARRKFEKRTKVDGSGKDGLIHISVEDHDPKRAAELANGYVEQFRNLSQHLAITEASQRRLFFEQELVQAKDNLAAAEEALKQTEQTTGLVELSSQEKALIESAATLRAQITAREVQIQGMQTYATGENAQLVQAQRELEGLRAQLARMGGSEDSASAGFLVPKGKVPEASLEYVRKLRDVKYSEAIFEILARQFEFAKLDEARQGALIQVVDPAVAPDKRSFPLVIPIVIVSTLVGFFMVIFAVLFQAGYLCLKDDPGNALKFNHIRKAFSFKG
jgi:uncharacterized protein involved in exopolysaccharide biosynthesis